MTIWEQSLASLEQEIEHRARALEEAKAEEAQARRRVNVCDQALIRAQDARAALKRFVENQKS